jgi:nucleoside phosphorylase
MKRFKKTFALNEKDIEPTCIVLPSNDRDLFASLEIIKSSRGLFYNTDTARGCSVISLKNRMFAGDCLLSLKDTNCSNIILFGSCGSFNLNPAEKVVSAGAFNMESFTELLRSGKTTEFDFTNPDEKLSDNLRKYIGRGIGREVFATVSSLMLEEIKGDIIKSSGAGCVDMESSQVFAAAEHAGIRALGVFYVTDTVGKLSFYDRYPKETADKIKGARKSLANQLCGFIKDELSPRN